MFNAQTAVTATNENPAGVVSTNGVVENVPFSRLSVAEMEWAMQLPKEHCDCCNRDVAYSAMAMAGLCDVCADELDELGEQVWQTEQDALSLLHW